MAENVEEGKSIHAIFVGTHSQPRAPGAKLWLFHILLNERQAQIGMSTLGSVQDQSMNIIFENLSLLQLFPKKSFKFYNMWCGAR
jgi:hypothetical protein